MISKLEFAYAAGLIDGEGCIFISRNKPNTKNREKNYRYYLEISVGMSDYAPIEWLAEKFGGGIYLASRSKSMLGRKDIWVWSTISNKAKAVLIGILPFLKAKKEQAIIALEFQEFKNTVNTQLRKEIDVLAVYHQYYLKLKEAKR